jgi:hypothetical protein
MGYLYFKEKISRLGEISATRPKPAVSSTVSNHTPDGLTYKLADPNVAGLAISTHG